MVSRLFKAKKAGNTNISQTMAASEVKKNHLKRVKNCLEIEGSSYIERATFQKL